MGDQTDRIDPGLAAGNRKSLASYRAAHFLWDVKDAVATITLNRPKRKNGWDANERSLATISRRRPGRRSGRAILPG